MISLLKFPVNRSIFRFSNRAAAAASYSSTNQPSFEINVKDVKDESEAMKLIKKTVESNPLVLFMKGSTDRPLCGFSKRVTQVLLQSPINNPFATVDVLSNEEIRFAIKRFSDWPTVPQLYVKGKFVGGCDIVYEMFSNGNFTVLLKENGLYSEEEI